LVIKSQYVMKLWKFCGPNLNRHAQPLSWCKLEVLNVCVCGIW
jgi:hypothetical protein